MMLSYVFTLLFSIIFGSITVFAEDTAISLNNVVRSENGIIEAFDPSLRTKFARRDSSASHKQAIREYINEQIKRKFFAFF